MKKKILIFTATYNEANTLNFYFDEIYKLDFEFDLLIIDDNSPDLTWKKLRDLEKIHKNFKLIIREKKLGLNTAHQKAFNHARENHYDYLITMDIDSHEPKTIPDIIRELEQGSDFVIGSRYMIGGKCDYTGFRNFISRYGNKFIKYLLNIKLDEFTTSFRGFNLKKMKDFDMNKLKFRGYSFLMEVVYRIKTKGYIIKEIPIHFKERQHGYSKISKIELPRTLFNVIRLFFEKFF
tara:strand:+ start:8305 stop:9012 length:708 start_codon:yes stop_codon:yes gene_type:complete